MTQLQNPLCHLALLLAYLISKVLPYVSTPEGIKFNVSKLSYLKPLESIEEIRRSVPWVKRPNNNTSGLRDENGYFSTAAVVFLAWMDRSSPLHKRLKEGAGFATTWGGKQGK